MEWQCQSQQYYSQQKRRGKGAKLKKETLETQERQFYVKGSFRNIDIRNL